MNRHERLPTIQGRIGQGQFLGDSRRRTERILPARIAHAVLVLVGTAIVLHRAGELRFRPVLHGCGAHGVAERTKALVVELVHVVAKELLLLPAGVVSYETPIKTSEHLTLNFGVDQRVDQRDDETLKEEKKHTSEGVKVSRSVSLEVMMRRCER